MIAPTPKAALYSPARTFIVSVEFLEFLLKLFLIIGKSGRIVKGAANPRIDIPIKKKITVSVATTKNPNAIKPLPVMRTAFPLNLFII